MTDPSDTLHTHRTMTSFLRALALPLLCAGSIGPMACAMTTGDRIPPGDAAAQPDSTPADAAVGDVAPSRDAVDPPRDAVDPTCPPRATFAVPAACAALDELATHPDPSAPNSFAVSALRPTRDTARPACASEPWQNRADARVRFTAPTGGTWRFTATGEELWALDVQRDCATSLACSGFPDVHGASASMTLTVDVPVQRGESVALTLDGCPVGAACAYALRAQWIGPLSCDFPGGAMNVCTSDRDACAIDPCDAERFRCVPEATQRIEMTRVRALTGASPEQVYFVGRARAPGGDASLRASADTILGRWTPSSAGPPTLGLSVRFGDLVDGEVDFFGSYDRAPGGVTAATVWFYDGADSAMHPGLTAPIERWSPRAVGEPCVPSSFAERCGLGLRCVTEGADRGVCRTPTAIEVTSLRAWLDAARETLTLDLAGESLGDEVYLYDVTVLDASGAPLARGDNFNMGARVEAPSNVPFRTTFELTQQFVRNDRGEVVRFRVPAGAARVRLVARDAMSRASAPVEAPVTPVTASPLGGPCDAPSLGCAAGLTCTADNRSRRARCAPTPAPNACGYYRTSPTWAPTTRGMTHTVSGVVHNVGGIVSCYGGRTPRHTTIDFVAPVTGAYAFTLSGLAAMEVRTACGGDAAPAACVEAAPGSSEVRTELRLAAEQHAFVEILSGSEFSDPNAYTLSVRVP